MKTHGPENGRLKTVMSFTSHADVHRQVMCIADARVSPRFIIYHSHAPDGRGPGSHRPRPEQSHLSLTLAIGNELVNVTDIDDSYPIRRRTSR